MYTELIMGSNGNPTLKLGHQCPLFRHNACYFVVQYVRDPITCWAPVHFTKSQIEFMTSYCWVKDTYYLPWNKPVPKYPSEKRQMIPYYQWIPFILAIQVSWFLSSRVCSGAIPILLCQKAVQWNYNIAYLHTIVKTNWKTKTTKTEKKAETKHRTAKHNRGKVRRSIGI